VLRQLAKRARGLVPVQPESARFIETSSAADCCSVRSWVVLYYTNHNTPAQSTSLCVRYLSYAMVACTSSPRSSNPSVSWRRCVGADAATRRKEIYRVNSIPSPSATWMLRMLQDVKATSKARRFYREISGRTTRWFNNIIIARDDHLVML
jgi:hypothetical protein